MGKKDKEKIEFFKNHKNPYNLTYQNFSFRVKGKDKSSWEKAMNEPLRNYDKELKNYFKNHENPNKISFFTFKNRIKSGMSKEEAMSFNRKLGKKREFFNNHENPHGLTYFGFTNRVKMGMSWEEAMSTPKKYEKYEEISDFYKKNKTDSSPNYQTFYKRVINGMSMEEAILQKANYKRLIHVFESLENPHDIPYNSFYYRVRYKKESIEKAMSYPIINRDYKKFWKNHPNRDKISYYTLKYRINNGMTPDEAMSFVKPYSHANFLKENNPHNLSYVNFLYRVNKLGMSPEEAVKFKEIPKNTMKNVYKNIKNPHGVSYQTFLKRIKSGMTPKEAMNYQPKKSMYKEIYENSKNPNNIPYSLFLSRMKAGMDITEAFHKEIGGSKKKYFEENNIYNIPMNSFRARMQSGETMEEALSRPLKKYTFPFGDLYLLYNGEYLKISDCEPLLPLDQCKKLYKSGIKLEKLFRNIN